MVFSIAHPEGDKSLGFVSSLLISSHETLNEIEDVFFGGEFKYTYNNQNKSFGNAMGVVGSKSQVDKLFELQDTTGVKISLTLNSTLAPKELIQDQAILDQFISYLSAFYERGLRVCTIGSIHLMRSGVLQKTFPDMEWKNTVNNHIKTAQEVVDFINLGYTTILLDRGLSRDLMELKRISGVKNKYPDIKLSLLVSEGCMPSCPFKTEHDYIGETIGSEYFNSLGNMTCSSWNRKLGVLIPRQRLDLEVVSTEMFKEFSKVIDVFKFSGRFLKGPNIVKPFKWVLSNNIFSLSSTTFKSIMYHNAMPLMKWDFRADYSGDTVELNDKNYSNDIKDSNSVWLSDKGLELEKVLSRCRSQCWNCHKCEDVFSVSHFDSILEL